MCMSVRQECRWVLLAGNCSHSNTESTPMAPPHLKIKTMPKKFYSRKLIIISLFPEPYLSIWNPQSSIKLR